MMGRKTVLVVDDEPNVLRVTVALVAALQYEVLHATNTSETIDILANQHVDVLLTDNVWRGTTEEPLPQQVKALKPETAIILLSGYDYQEELPAEVSLALLKPVGLLDLKSAIQKVLQQRSIVTN